ncbi:MAG: T9SS type A sorting domain-containing protein [Candidatus Cloacimonetes bacterium]|nr:T9SS type A sorting domain-containing protein [Candidatus Cloacimonadota bacterium]
MKKMKLFFAFIILATSLSFLYAGWDFVAGGYISNIDFVGNDGWAILSEGLVIHTPNGGTTWEYQHTATSERLYDVSFVDNLEGWVAGNDGLIFHTTDGGNIWTQQNSTITSGLQSIIFVDALNGWAAGSFGNVVHTSDGGVTWSSQTSSISSKIYSIYFVDALNGWAVAASDYIIHTTDGGATWVTQTNPTTDSMQDVIFYDANEGWATGLKKIIHTVDGGTTWVAQTNPADENLYGIGMGDNNYLWVVGIDGEILATTDGGTTWTEQSFSLDWFWGAYFADSSTGWIVGSGGVIYKTTDGGSSWVAQQTGTSSGLRRTVFVDENNVWGCGTKGFIIHSGDGGLTWENKDSGFDDWIWDITFASDLLHGWATGDDQTGETPILATVDGGETWIQQLTGIYVDVVGIEAINNTEVFAAAQDGIILHTTDGGTTWNQQTSGVSSDFKSIEMLSGDIGWAVGADGTIIYTNDGGTTWVLQTSGTTESIYDISFIDPLTGWAVGYNGVILHTIDGGTTWSFQLTGTTDDFTRLSVIDANEVWVVAGDGFHTTDGGVTWTEVPIPCSLGLWGVDFANSNLGVAMGNGGIVTRYTSEELNPPQNLFVTDEGYATWEAPENSRDFICYNVYLDGVFDGFTTDLFYQYTGLVNNQTYLSEVTALYDDGESDPVDYQFTYIGGTTLLPPEDVSVDPNSWLLTWLPPGGTISSDDFESYVVGEYLAVQSDLWTTWTNSPGSAEDAYVSDAQALSGTQSVVVEGSSDLVYIMDEYTSGIYSMEVNLYIPTGYCGYWNLQKTNLPYPGEWAFQIMFDVTGIASADAGASAALTFPFSFDTWINMELVVDLNADWCEIWVDGVMLHEYQWTLGTFGTPGLLTFGGMNLYAWASTGNSPLCYFDDIALHVIEPADGTRETRDLLGFHIYLDDMVIPLTTVDPDVYEYQYTGLTVGNTYMAGVSALYDEGESEIVEYEFIALGDIILPPENFTAEVVTFNDVLLNWEAPGGGGGLYELIQHDGNPQNGYYQAFNSGYGVVYDVSGYTDVTLEMLDFRHSSWGVYGIWDYALHIVDWDTYTEVVVVTGLQTTGDDIWEEEIDLGSVSETGLVGVFMEPMGNVASDAYPCIDSDDVGPDGLSYYGPLANYAGMSLSGIGDFLMDLWIMAEEVDGVVQARRFSANMGTGSGMPRIATRTSVKLNSKIQHYNNERIFQTVASDDLRILLGYKIYKDGAEIIYIEDPDILTYTDVGVEPGTHGYYATAMFDDGESDPSDLANVEIILPIPQGVEAVFNYPIVMVTWDPISEGRDFVIYNVKRDGEQVGTATNTMYPDPGLASGDYCYNITAEFDGGYESEWSDDAWVTVTESDNILIPVRTELTGNYPNPFNPETNIKFALNKTSYVSIKVYNIKGAVVRTLVDGEMNAAYHKLIWDGKDKAGKQVGSGIFFYKMKAEKYTSTKKMILMK